MTSTPAGVTIRPERGDDVDAIADVVATAFKSQAEARLVERIRSSPEYIPELALVAEVEGEVVGHVMISHTVLRDGDVEHCVAMLSPLAVAPSHERRGIGSALVEEVVSRAAQRGEPLVVLQGSPDFYGRLGFEHAGPHGIEHPLPSWAPPEAGQVRRLRHDDPSLRGQVVHPPAFDEVDDR